jgi:hypothetical protein
MTPPARAVLAGAALLAAARPAAAQPPAQAASAPAAEPAVDLPFDVTASMSAAWHGDRDYGELFGRINLARLWGAWQAALRLDTSTFIEAPGPETDDRYTVEKASVGWASRSLEVTAGDAYVSFGRGLGLSLRKVDELGIDTTLRGAKLLLHQGALSGTAVAGYANINNVDEATGASVGDPYDLIAGAQAQVAVGGRVTLGTYAAAIAFHDGLGLVPTDRYADRSVQAGVTIDAPRATEHAGFYLEAMGQDVMTEPETEHPRGFGLYGSATAYAGRATIVLEGKAYGDLTPLHPDLGDPAFDAVAYSSPPTVERALQTIENPATEVAGGRVRADWSFSPALLAYVNYGSFRDWHGYADPASGEIVAGTIHDPYAGAEVRWDDARSWALVSAGWRAVVLDSGEVVRRDGHLELDASQALGARWSITLQALHEELGKHESAILDESFRQGTLIAGFRLQPSLTVAGGYDYTTEPTQPKRDYFNGTVGWDFTPSSSLRLQVGSMRGGLKCISGVCRVLPPFEGVKLSATLRF